MPPSPLHTWLKLSRSDQLYAKPKCLKKMFLMLFNIAIFTAFNSNNFFCPLIICFVFFLCCSKNLSGWVWEGSCYRFYLHIKILNTRTALLKCCHSGDVWENGWRKSFSWGMKDRSVPHTEVLLWAGVLRVGCPAPGEVAAVWTGSQCGIQHSLLISFMSWRCIRGI